MLPLHSLLSLPLLVSITTAIRPLTLPNTLSQPTALSLVIKEGEEVNTNKYPDWAGNWNPEDCVRAQRLFEGRLAFWDPVIRWTFWSRKWETMPEGQQWELPFGWRYRERPLSSSPVLYLYLFLVLHFFFVSKLPTDPNAPPSQLLPTLFVC